MLSSMNTQVVDGQKWLTSISEKNKTSLNKSLSELMFGYKVYS